jgi:hypothetical protein
MKASGVAAESLKPAACPLVLLVVHRSFSSGALGFAQRSLLLLSSLLVLGSCARRPLSFSPVSAVIWLECHWISVMRPIDFGPDDYIYAGVRVLPVLLFAPWGSSEDNVEVGRSLRDGAQLLDADRRFKGGQIWLGVKSSFSIPKRVLASFSRRMAERTYSSTFPRLSALE